MRRTGPTLMSAATLAAAPAAGWWGFAALNTADYTLAREGTDKPVELGAVLWVRFEEWTGQ